LILPNPAGGSLAELGLSVQGKRLSPRKARIGHPNSPKKRIRFEMRKWHSQKGPILVVCSALVGEEPVETISFRGETGSHITGATPVA
jgi:hypothetical protein